MEMEEMRRDKSQWSTHEGEDRDNQENMEEDKRSA